MVTNLKESNWRNLSYGSGTHSEYSKGIVVFDRYDGVNVFSSTVAAVPARLRFYLTLNILRSGTTAVATNLLAAGVVRH